MWIGAYTAPGTITAPSIATTSLPGGTVGTAYSAQLLVINNNGPVVWSATGLPAGLSINAAGLISGTPTTSGTVTANFSVLDSLNQTASSSIPIMILGGAQPAPPQAIWTGRTTSFDQIVSCWPPLSGPAPTGYNVYRRLGTSGSFGTPLNASPIVPTPWPYGGSGAAPQIFFVDQGPLTASTTYQYQWTALNGASESSPTAPATITTLAGQVSLSSPSTPPAVATRFVQPLSIPAVTPVTCTTTLQFANALAACNVNGPNLIVLTHGNTFQENLTGGFHMPALTAAGSLYVISDQVPEFNSSGALPAYSFVSQDVEYTQFTLVDTSPPNGIGVAAGGTGATLIAPWGQRSACYAVAFTNSAAFETRVAQFTQGSASITWLGGAGLSGSAGTSLYVGIGNFVTPTDIPNMPTILVSAAFTNALSFNSACQNVRFIGINFGLTPSQTAETFALIQFYVTCNNVMFDRCVLGQRTYDFTLATSVYSQLRHGIFIQCDNFMVHQCFFWGCVSSSNESHCVVSVQGNGIYIHNCFTEAGSCSHLSGGLPVPQADPPANIVFENNFSYKPTEWLQFKGTNAGPSNWIKNHFETKTCYTGSCNGNLMQNCIAGPAGQQHGRFIVLTPRCQQAGTSSTPITALNPWNHISDMSVYSNKMYNGERGIIVTGPLDFQAEVYCARVAIYNNNHWVSPSNLFIVAGGEYGSSIELQGPTDVTVSNNNFVCNPANVNTFSTAMFALGTGQTYAKIAANDRNMILNNISVGFEFGYAEAFSFTPGSAGWPAWFPNSLWQANIIPPADTNAYTGPLASTFKVAGTAVGYFEYPANGNTMMPVPSSNWNVVTGTYATASTIGGPLGASFPSTVPASDPFPRIVTSPIGGTFQASYASSTWQTWAAKHNIVIFGWYIGIEQAMGTTLAAVHANMLSLAKAKNIICRPVMYFMQQQIATAFNNGGNSNTEHALINKINSVNWWIRSGSGYPSGTIVTGDTTASGVVNVARGGPVDSVTGLTVNQFFPYYAYNVLVLGNAVSLFGEASSIAPNPNTVGISMDNQYWAPRQDGSWTWGTTVTGFAGTASGAALTQQGNADMVAAWQAIWPDLIVIGNVNYGINTVQNGGGAVGNLTAQKGLYDVAFFELVIGPNSSEQFVGFGSATSGTMLELINQESTMNATGTVVFHQAGRPGGVAWTAPPSGTPVGWQTTTWVAADWQALRYGENWAMLRNWHYQMMMDSGSDQNNAQDMLWSDTFDRGGKQTVGWLGSPTDGPQSAAQFPNGVWGRHFQNGLVLVNPVGNGTQTVTLPSGVYFTLPYNGYSDHTVNTDTQVNSVTLLAGDGRTLAKVA